MFVDFGRMGFGGVLSDAKSFAVGIDVLEHVSVLMALEPSILPIEGEGFGGVDEVGGGWGVVRMGRFGVGVHCEVK